jgi:hypothetical protein
LDPRAIWQSNTVPGPKLPKGAQGAQDASPSAIAEAAGVFAGYRRERFTTYLYLFAPLAYPARMPDDRDKLSPAMAEDVADALAFALRFQGRKRVQNADELMSSIVAKRLVEQALWLRRMKKPPIGGSTPPYRG